MAVIDLGISMRSQDLAYLRRELASMPKKINKAVANSLNSAMETGQKYIAKQLSNKVTAPKGRIIKDIRIVRAYEGKLTAGVTFYGRAVGALQFKAIVYAPRKGGVKFQPSKGQPYLKFPGGFRGVGIGGRDGSGNTHLWIRRDDRPKYHVGSKAHHKPNVGRLMQRIKPLYGPKMITVWTRNPDIRVQAKQRTMKRLHERMLSQVDRMLSRKKADRPADAPTLDEA
jgi:hypothetical protein